MTGALFVLGALAAGAWAGWGWVLPADRPDFAANAAAKALAPWFHFLWGWGAWGAFALVALAFIDWLLRWGGRQGQLLTSPLH